MIISRTPLRISLAGGGTDTPAFYKHSTGAVVSFAINKYVYVAVNGKFDDKFRASYSITENVEKVSEFQHDIIRNTLTHFKPKHGLEIVSVADIPGGGTGLGSSSSFTVGLINALNYHYEMDYLPPGILAELAYKYESESHPDIGKQDHYAAAHGGLNLFRFKKNSVSVEPLEARDTEWFLLLYTGITRSADELLKAQRKGFEADNIAIGKEMAEIAEDFEELYIADVLRKGWELKKKLYKGVTDDQIDDWYYTGMINGALGGKLCGAGGGGFLLFFAPPDTHHRIVKTTGLRRVDFKIETEGSKIIYG